MNHYQDNDTGGALVVLVAAAIGVTLLIWLIEPAKSKECEERPLGGSYWSWRIIDGKRCWYQGHHVIPKSNLHWPKKRMIDPIFPNVKVVDPKELNEIDALAPSVSGPIIMYPELVQSPPTTQGLLSGGTMLGWPVFINIDDEK
jgi:hypothetical protein